MAQKAQPKRARKSPRPAQPIENFHLFWNQPIEVARENLDVADCVPDGVLEPFVCAKSPGTIADVRRAINEWAIQDGRGRIYLNSEYDPERPQTPPLTAAQLRSQCAAERRFYCDGDGDRYTTAALRIRVDRIIQEQRRIPSESTLTLPVLTGAESPQRLLQILEEVMVWCEGQAKPNGRKGVGGAPDKWEVYFEFAVEFRKHTDDATDKTIAAAFVEKYRSAADELGLTDLLGPARAEKIRKARSDRKADGLLIDK